MKLSQRTATKNHHILLFGPPKSGKSYLAGKLSSHKNLLWFDLEGGHNVLFQLPPEQQERIELIDLPDTRGFPIAIETMLKVIKGSRVDICETHGKASCAICKKDSSPFVTVELNALDNDTVVVVDSLTQLTNSAIAHITKNQPEDYKMEFDDWGNLGKLMDTFLSYVQQAPFSIICISHETEVDMVDGKPKIVPTAGTRNFSRNTAKYFDEVFYCEVRNKKHVVGSSTTYANNILTGSRSGQVTEGNSEASLVPIFTGERIAQASVEKVAPSPAQTAMTALQRLQAKTK
jgi:hypothetical protein